MKKLYNGSYSTENVDLKAQARELELDCAQFYLDACERLATACTATAPYLIRGYREVDHAFRLRGLYISSLARFIDSETAEYKATQRSLGSANVYLRIVEKLLE
jgi:hypothetical protein